MKIITFIVAVAVISGAAYFYYRMNFADIYVDIGPHEAFRYYIKTKLDIKDYKVEIKDVSIVKRTLYTFPFDESKVKEQIKQAIEEKIKREVRLLSGLFECSLLILPTQVGSKYINQARADTEKCYIQSREKGIDRAYSNREYTITKGKISIGDLNIITNLPYCLDFCDGKKVKKGETLEGVALAEYISQIFSTARTRLYYTVEDVALAEYISQIFPTTRTRVHYTVSEIVWNTVIFKIEGSIEPDQTKTNEPKLQGKIYGNAVYDREKRLFTSLVIYMSISFSGEFSHEAFIFPVTARAESNISTDMEADIRMEVDK